MLRYGLPAAMSVERHNYQRAVNMKKKAFLLFFFCALAFLPACGDEKTKGNARQPSPVSTSLVEKSDVPRQLDVVGNMRPSASVEVKARVTGEIRQINFREGQDVLEGQALIEIDPRPYRAVVNERRAQLAKSRAQLAKASEDMRRYGRLVGNGYVSRETYDQAATDVSVLKSAVRADEAALESGLLDLSYCTINSPISGRAGALSLDRGNLVNAQDGKSIVTIDCISPIYVSFSVPEAYLPAILERMSAGDAILTVTPIGGKPVAGELSLVDNSVDTKTGTIRLRGIFANQGRNLWPGQFVNVSLALGHAREALTVPSRAIQKGREETYIYVVKENGQVDYRVIRPLFEHEGRTVVEGEIGAGDEVVVDGQIRLYPGADVIRSGSGESADR